MINVKLKALFAHELRQAKKRRNQSLSLLYLRFNQKRPHNIHFERLEPHLLHPTTPFDPQIPPQLQPRKASKSKSISSVAQVQSEATPQHPFRASRATSAAPNDPVRPSDPAPTPAKKSEPIYRPPPLICNPELASRVADKFLDIPITVTAQEVLAVAPDLCSQVRESITTQKFATQESEIISVSQDKVDLVEEDDEEAIEGAVLRAIQLNQQASEPPESHNASHNHAVSVFSVNIAPDRSETCVRSLPKCQAPDPARLVMAKDAYSIRSIEPLVDNKPQVECVNTRQAVTVHAKPHTRCCLRFHSHNPEELLLDPVFLLSAVLCLMVCALLLLTLLSLSWIPLALAPFCNLAKTASAAINPIPWADFSPFSKQISHRTSLSKLHWHFATFIAFTSNL
ncbi:hypothetical protein CVT24_004665, partial [Panaeolus cyanescens]